MEIPEILTRSPAGVLNDVLNPDQNAKMSGVLARNGWGSPNSQLNRMARAVVKRESNGDAKAYNTVHCGQDCAGPFGEGNAVGWFQICDRCHAGKLGSPRTKVEFRKWAEDSDNNAKLARRIHLTSGWGPWSASGGIPVPTDWDPVVVTDKDTLIGGAGEVASAAASPFIGIAKEAMDLIGALFSADTWFRIGKTALGSVFIIVGVGALVFIIANQASGGKLVRRVTG